MRVQVLMPDCLDKPWGGVGEQARHIFPKLDKTKYQFDIVGWDKGKEHLAENIRYLHTMVDEPFLGLDSFSVGMILQSYMVECALRYERPDIVHAYDWSTYLAGTIVARHWKVPMVSTMQLSVEKLASAPDVFNTNGYIALSKIESFGMDFADKLIHVAPSYAKLFGGTNVHKTTIIPNGIELPEWKQVNKVQLPGNGRIKVVYIGRLSYQKNVISIVNANIPPEIDVIIIGGQNGSDVGYIELLQRIAAGKRNIHFVGAKYGQEKVDWMMSADATIVPSVHEPFGITALEGLAAKTILLSSFVHGMQDFLTEDVAINCGVGRQTIEDALGRLLTMTPTERDGRIERGLEICKKYNWDDIAREMDKVYTEVYNRS